MSRTRTKNNSTEKNRKLIITGITVLALVLVAIFSTLAYLTSTTNTLDNVMTAGKIEAFLDETETTAYGVATTDPATRIPQDPTATQTTSNNYTLVSGHEYIKDPQLHVKKGSESCYVYMIVDDQMNGAITGVDTYEGASPEAQMAGTETNKWTKLDVVPPAGQSGNVYAYNSIIEKNIEYDQMVESFKTFKLNKDLTNDQIATLGTKQIIINGTAIQSDGFASAQAAWEAVYGGGAKTDPELKETLINS